jgi:hypothetical protein
VRPWQQSSVVTQGVCADAEQHSLVTGLKVPSQQFAAEVACSRDVLGMQQMPPSLQISPGPQPFVGHIRPWVFATQVPDESFPLQHEALLTTPVVWLSGKQEHSPSQSLDSQSASVLQETAPATIKQTLPMQTLPGEQSLSTLQARSRSF